MGVLYKDRYRIEDRIGRGSFGSIYRVTDMHDRSR